MCGFVGSAFLPPGASFDVDAGLVAIRHRGPDDTSVVRREGAVFGFTRLKILDLTDAGRQPMSSPDGRFTLVFNGEIYNHHALRRELGGLGYTFRSRSDTEAIVHGYSAWGPRVVERLDGMFALAVWDDRERTLLLARDRPGKKPLFYSEGPLGFAFGSEPKALTAAGVPFEMDLEAFVPLFAFGQARAPRSMNRHVRELPPATTLLLREGGRPKLRRYWTPPFEKKSRVGEAEARGRVRELVERAVARRLEADVPVGAFLSGGVDSSIVVAAMARQLGDPAKVRTFSIGFEGDHGFDETAYARRVAEHVGTTHTEFKVKPAAFDLVEALVRAHDGPFGDSSAIPTSIVSGLTREHATVALTGDGGDELFCGYNRFLAVEALERVPRAARRAAGLLARHMDREGTALPARVGRSLARAELDLPERLLAWTTVFPMDLTRVLAPELLAEVDPGGAIDEVRAIGRRSEGATPLSRVLDLNWHTYLCDDLLVKADRSSMMHSLELRSPFLDTELVEYVAKLPDAYKRRGTERKWILRRAFADLVPDEVFTRKKMGFGLPLGAWFRGPLRAYLEEQLKGSAALYRYVRRDFVDGLLRAHFAGGSDHGHMLWQLLTLQVWLRSLPGEG